jgi:glycoprotein endo-alpha-1,2-mannosidase
MKTKHFLVLILSFPLVWNTNAQYKHSKESNFPSYKGLVMAGYQGWFNCEGDGADRGWTHYQKGKKFEDGNCTIDFWPEMSEYKKQYKTPFKFADGTTATVFSSYDESSVDLHFQWMKEYGIDGVFMQRFFEVIENPKRLKHADKVLASALKAAHKYGIAICLMYDIGSMNDTKYQMVLEDWKHLVDDLKLTRYGKKSNYLFHNDKPLIALWGIGSSGRKSGHIPEIFEMMDFFKNDPQYGGCSIHLGVPSRWRSLGADTKGDPRLLDAIKKADIVHPWFVGRYNENTYEKFRKEVIVEDIKWCKDLNLSYAPTVYPGFSWYNMKPNEISNKVPRNKGQFYWKQLAGAISSGAEMIYVAMFDEIDEGTAIMKCAKKVPVGKSIFVPIEKEVPTDHYLWLTNQAAKMLRNEIPFSETIPKRE